jgi:predicted O-methyltransferase YrrM
MHELIKDIYGRADRRLLGSAISPAEGELLQTLIRQNGCRRTVEVGCAFGLSSLFICDALSVASDPHHVIIDPFQATEFENQGIRNLERAGFTFFRLIEEPSELALPSLLRAGEEFDLALIDGYHTFDHTLLDFFFLNRMLKVGGIIVIDDTSMPAVNKAVKYISTFPCYRLVGAINQRGWRRRLLNTGKLSISTLLSPVTAVLGGALSSEFLDGSLIRRHSIRALDYATMLAFQKLSDDDRDSTWYEYF